MRGIGAISGSWFDRWWPGLLVLMAFLLGGTVPVVVVMLSAAAPDQSQRQACDVVVQTVLTTHDPLELQRAGILVQAMNCDVARRAAAFLRDQMDRPPD